MNQFMGHTHKDEFKMFYDTLSALRPTGFAFVTPSVTPHTDVNLAYRIYTIDGDYEGSTRVSKCRVKGLLFAQHYAILRIDIPIYRINLDLFKHLEHKMYKILVIHYRYKTFHIYCSLKYAACALLIYHLLHKFVYCNFRESLTMTLTLEIWTWLAMSSLLPSTPSSIVQSEILKASKRQTTVVITIATTKKSRQTKATIIILQYNTFTIHCPCNVNRSDLGLENILPEDFDLLVRRLRDEDDFFDFYYKYEQITVLVSLAARTNNLISHSNYYSGSPVAVNPSQSDREEIICKAVTTNYDDDSKCQNILNGF